jgi:glycosyltransferase involved in cell wall biosynthesis
MADTPDDRARRRTSSLSALVERRSFAVAKRHVGVSEACLRSKDLPDSTPTSVVYNPIDPAILRAKQALAVPAPPKKKYDLLFAGRLIDGKGVYVLMDALRHLDADGHALRVCMAGSGEAASRLEAESALLRNVRVDFPGALDREGMAQAYASSRLFVIPSSSHQEGMPLVVAEALYFGLPVIGSNQEMILEGIGEAGLSFESGNADDLADQIRRLTQNPSLYTDLHHAAQARSTLFLPDAFLSSMQTILSEAVTPRQRRPENHSGPAVRRPEPANH